LVYVEEKGWGKEEKPILPDSIALRYEITPADSIEVGDTIQYKFFYPSNQIAIEGECVVEYQLAKSKRGIWNYYYKNGDLWSTREYNRLGRNIAIKELKSPNGEDLGQGFGRHIGKHKHLTGYNYIYNENREIDFIARYSGGSILEKIDKSLFNETQLNRLIIRIFKIDENKFLEELSFEEAFELQKINNKTILLNASTNWNGYTRKGYKQLFSKSHIAKFIDDNFILAYLDIEDSKPIIVHQNNEEIILDGAVGRGQHGLVKKLVRAIRATPTFIFIGPNLEVLHTHKGIELKEDEFMKSLEFFTSKSYQNTSWKEYLKE